MFRKLLAAVRTIILVPVFFVYTLIASAVIVVFGAFRPSSPMFDGIVKRWASVFLKIPPVRYTIEGLENVEPTKRYVVVSNHLSLFDIPMLFWVLPIHGRFLSKKEVFKIPLVGRAMRMIGIIEINRASGGSSRQAIIDGVKIAADRGYSLIVFPEGTRGSGEEPMPFKKGAFRIAIDTGLPVLPVVIEGTDRISRPGSRLYFPGKARVVVLEPIETADLTNKDNLNDLAKTVEASMNDTYAELHKDR